ncbi:MAG: hypothetical protein NVSMB3_01530 [Acidobacteriaceae bacterium]
MMETRWEPWQVLDVGSIWMREFGSALSRQAAMVAWAPVMSRFALFSDWERVVELKEPALTVRQFPLQRGYARESVRRLVRFEDRLLRRLERAAGSAGVAARSPLICSTPFYAPLAERWAGPVVYYSTDLTAEYEGVDGGQVRELDIRMCRVARAVCPNSTRIAEYFASEAGCDPAKITVVPNATRESNVADEPLLEPGALPEDVRDVPRPIAGVIGDLSGNMDWSVIADTMERTPELNWVFVGPTTRTIADRLQNSGRERVMRGRARFVGSKPYGELQRYARSFDVAVLPYRKKEPTYSGSSTRFYEHLTACRPMVATRGFAELMDKLPLLKLVDTGEEMAVALRELASVGFRDGLETARWEASRAGTWEERARTLRKTLD